MKKRNKLKIGILTHNYPAYSSERKDAGIFIYDFAQELSLKVDVFVFCPDFGGKKERYKRVPVTWFRWDEKNDKFGNWQLFNPVYVYKFFKLIYIGQREAIKFACENELDYILSCWTIPSGIFAWRINKALNVPYASWSLGSDVNKYSKIPVLKQLIYLSLISANQLFANSYALVDKIQKISKKTAIFLPAITNFEIKTKQIKNKDNKFHFLFVGRLEFVKGPDVLTDAVCELSKKYNNFVVDILGDGSMGDDLRNNSKEFSQFLIFHGWADERKVSEFMGKSDCLVIPSRNESLPLVLIEAAKKYLPVVATNVGDCKRVIEKYKIGCFVNKENPVDLALGMLKMIETKSFARKGFVKLISDFSQEKAVDLFLAKINVNKN